MWEEEQRIVIRRIFGIRGKLPIFRRRYIVGILTYKANISTYYLVPYRLSTDSKARDLEWPFCVKFCFAPVYLELWSLAFKAWLLLTCSECCRRTLNRKEQLRHGTVSLPQHGFLVLWEHHGLQPKAGRVNVRLMIEIIIVMNNLQDVIDVDRAPLKCSVRSRRFVCSAFWLCSSAHNVSVNDIMIIDKKLYPFYQELYKPTL